MLRKRCVRNVKLRQTLNWINENEETLVLARLGKITQGKPELVVPCINFIFLNVILLMKFYTIC